MKKIYLCITSSQETGVEAEVEAEAEAEAEDRDSALMTILKDVICVERRDT